MCCAPPGISIDGSYEVMDLIYLFLTHGIMEMLKRWYYSLQRDGEAQVPRCPVIAVVYQVVIQVHRYWYRILHAILPTRICTR